MLQPSLKRTSSSRIPRIRTSSPSLLKAGPQKRPNRSRRKSSPTSSRCRPTAASRPRACSSSFSMSAWKRPRKTTTMPLKSWLIFHVSTRSTARMTRSSKIPAYPPTRWAPTFSSRMMPRLRRPSIPTLSSSTIRTKSKKPWSLWTSRSSTKPTYPKPRALHEKSSSQPSASPLVASSPSATASSCTSAKHKGEVSE